MGPCGQRRNRRSVVAIDGKTLRRSHDRAADKSAIHMVSAWASANRLILGQTKVDERSNEITAIPELLSTLDVSGCTVTIDAMGCQKGIATTIIDQGADYVLALKENQPQLHQDVTETFEPTAGSISTTTSTVNKGHSRHDGVGLSHYRAMRADGVVMIESERIDPFRPATTFDLPNDARVLPQASVENSPSAFGEDDSRVRHNAAPYPCRRMALCSSVRPHHKGVWPPSASARMGRRYLLLVLAQ